MSIAASSTLVFNLFGDWNLYSKYGLLFFSNALLLVVLHAIILGFQPRRGLNQAAAGA
jgi:hypothetical protein